jgi:hypothetical protein
MNDRIKELIVESYSPYSTDSIDLDKFAKAIINECINAINNSEKLHVYTSFDSAQHNASVVFAKKAIREHFGLE